MRGFSFWRLVLGGLAILVSIEALDWMSEIRKSREAAALRTLKYINTAQLWCRARNPELGYGTLDELRQLGLVTELSPGYLFQMTTIPGIPHRHYNLFARPNGWVGGKKYFTTEHGDIVEVR